MILSSLLEHNPASCKHSCVFIFSSSQSPRSIQVFRISIGKVLDRLNSLFINRFGVRLKKYFKRVEFEIYLFFSMIFCLFFSLNLSRFISICIIRSHSTLIDAQRSRPIVFLNTLTQELIKSLYY